VNISGHWSMAILVIALTISSCKKDTSQGGNVLFEMNISNPIRPHLPYVKAEITKIAKVEEEPDSKLSSVYFTKACCDGVDEQLLLECCCPDVLELFEEKLSAGDWDFIGKLTSGDEVFAVCRYHPDYQNKFEEIENKYLEEDDDEEWN